MGKTFVMAASLLLLGASAFAQQRPLVTEDPETVGEGQVLLEAGLDYQRDAKFPASGLKGNLLRVPLVGLSVGVSSIAEIQIDGGLFNHLSLGGGTGGVSTGSLPPGTTSTSTVEDLVVGAKVRLVSEGSVRPGFGVRFATRLPTASRESGLGLGTTDFFASILAAKTVESVRVVVNIGAGTLSNPTQGGRQNHVLTYGTSFARAATQSTEVVGELNGRLNLTAGTPALGTESRGTFRVGARHTRGTVRVDAAVLVGVTTKDPTVGVAAGVTYVFNAFRVP